MIYSYQLYNPLVSHAACPDSRTPAVALVPQAAAEASGFLFNQKPPMDGLGYITEEMFWVKVNKQRGGFRSGKTFGLKWDFQNRKLSAL